MPTAKPTIVMQAMMARKGTPTSVAMPSRETTAYSRLERTTSAKNRGISSTKIRPKRKAAPQDSARSRKYRGLEYGGLGFLIVVSRGLESLACGETSGWYGPE